MTEEQIRKLITRLLISFLTKQWKGRSHGGLSFCEDVEAEVQRFVDQFVEL